MTRSIIYIGRKVLSTRSQWQKDAITEGVLSFTVLDSANLQQASAQVLQGEYRNTPVFGIA